MLDASGSINEENFKLVKQFTEDIVRDLPIDNGRVSVTFATYKNIAKTFSYIATYYMKIPYVTILLDVTYYHTLHYIANVT